MLSNQELLRYSRQIVLPNLGVEGQQRLKAGRVLVIGAGGLGSPALLYLTAAGVGNIGIVDFDVVDESNLQRQILYGHRDVGKPKAELARDRLNKQNPNVNVEIFPSVLNSQNAMDVIARYEVIIDGSDNLPTRYLVNDACVFLKKPLVYGAIFQFEGQVSVFNETSSDGTVGPNYRDLFPEPPPPEMVPSCAEGGVMGVLPGIIGAMQANEAIKLLTGMGTTLNGRLLLFDSLDFTTRLVKLHANPNNPVSGQNPTIRTLIDYHAFCNPARTRHMEEIQPLEVKRMLDAGERFQLIDVREEIEYQLANIGAVNIPLSRLDQQKGLIRKDMAVVIHCKTGQRSERAIQKLQESGFKNLKNMKGGLMQWRKEVDPELLVI